MRRQSKRRAFERSGKEGHERIHYSRRCASRSRCASADANGSTNRSCHSQRRQLRLKLTITAHVVLFAVTRRDSGAAPASKNSSSSRPQTYRTGIFHHQQITPAAAAVAFPFAVQLQDHHHIRSTARLLCQAFALLPGKRLRNPMGPGRRLDRRVPAPADGFRFRSTHPVPFGALGAGQFEFRRLLFRESLRIANNRD